MADVGIATGPGIDGLDRREEQRFVLLLRPAKVITHSGEYLCILRDVAAKGVRLKLFHPLPPERFMVIALANGDRYDAEKIWERGEQAGFVFTNPAQLNHLLEERSRFPKRPLRVRIERDAVLTIASARIPASLHDLSQQGGCIECDAPLATDQRLRIDIAGIPGIDAKVRWRHGKGAGLVFEQTFKLDALAKLLHKLQPFGPAIPEDDEDAIFRQAKSG